MKYALLLLFICLTACQKQDKSGTTYGESTQASVANIVTCTAPTDLVTFTQTSYSDESMKYTCTAGSGNATNVVCDSPPGMVKYTLNGMQTAHMFVVTECQVIK